MKNKLLDEEWLFKAYKPAPKPISHKPLPLHLPANTPPNRQRHRIFTSKDKHNTSMSGMTRRQVDWGIPSLKYRSEGFTINLIPVPCEEKERKRTQTRIQTSPGRYQQIHKAKSPIRQKLLRDQFNGLRKALHQQLFP